MLDKYYIDALLDDGSVLLVYIGKIVLAGVALARVSTELFLPDGSRIGGSALGMRLVRRPGFMQCGPVELRGEQLRFATRTLRGELTYRARAAPWTARVPFFARGGHALHWDVELPDADVQGQLHVAGRTLQIAGRGYRDRVWFDFPLARLPLRQLHWGRAYAGSHASTWTRAELADGALIEAGWQDGESLPGVPPALELTQDRTLVHGPVIDLEALHLGPLRPLLRWTTHDPVQHKWAAAARLAGVAGRAVHEVVTWKLAGP